MSAATNGTTDLLVEVGGEELPPKTLAKLARAFHGELAKRLLNDADLRDAATHSEAFWSPRRIAVRITGLRALQPERTVDRLGPAVAQAFGADGKPTKAAEGFARSCGVALEQLGQKDGKLHFRTTLPGQPLAALVPDAVRGALEALPIPKRMRWGAGEALFVRPVHWLVVLAGEKVVECEVMGVWSGRESRGHRFHHPAPVPIARPADYVEALKRAKVWLDGDALASGSVRDEIVRQVAALAAQAGGRYGADAAALHRDAELVAEVAALCEWPVAALGDFDPRFLELPPEVLTLTLEHHQRYFPLRASAGGALLPRFVYVANVVSKQPDEIKRGNERVIVPRLSDAMFFWQQDRRERLADRAAGLGAVVFQKELGTYADKSRRVAALAGSIAGRIGADAAQVRHAAAIAKADLLSSLVGEFPELQGTLGRHLALADGEAPEVAAAMEEQYLPRFAGDRLPATRVGQALALADKLDTLAGIFAIGQKPSGDKDPFALRRLALGAMRILIEGKLDLDLKALVAEALAGHAAAKPAAGLDAELYQFLMERLRAWYVDAGRRADVFNAVLARAPARPLDFDARMKAVEAFLGLPEAVALAAANKRCANILRQAGGDYSKAAIDAALVAEPGERALHEALTGGEIAWVEGLLEQGAYESALRRLASLKGPVDQFFDGVMVMAEDPKVRANRLALLARLQGLFLHVADLAELQVE